MSPFKITCVTCQARLTVRSASLIGQILGCPKCGSMVQVAAPAGHGGAEAAAGVATVAVTPSAFETIAPDVSLASNSFEDVADIGADLESTAAAPSLTPQTVRPTAAMAKPAATGLSTVKLVAIGVGSALLGSALVAAALTLLRSEPPVAPPATNSVGAPASTQAVAPRVDDESITEEPLVVAPAQTPDENPVHPEPAQLEPTASEPVVIEPAVDPIVTATAPPVVPDETIDADPQPDDSPRLRIDPLDLDPEGLDLATLMNGGNGVQPEGLGLNDVAAEPAAPVESEAAVIDDPAAQVPPGPMEPPEQEEAEVEPPAAVEVLLARRVGGVKIADMPLCRFLDFATALSAVPVSVSPAELRLAAASAATPVSVELQDATIEEILTTALKPLRLAPVVEDGQIVLRRSGEDRRRELAYPVDDLLSGDFDAAALAAWVERFVAPESWQAGGGPGRVSVDGTSLRIDHTERVGYETILFLEQYRIARGLPPRSKYPQQLLQAWVGKSGLNRRLAAPATFTFTRPTALREIFRWWQEESDTAVLVDWPALAEQRLAPHSRAIASAAAVPWSVGMESALKPLGLAWRPVDARSIQITTLVRLESEPVLEMYRLKDAASRGADGDAKLRARVAELAEAAAFDAEHGVLIVRQASDAQRRFAGWLVAEGLLTTEETGSAARSDAAANPAAVSE